MKKKTVADLQKEAFEHYQEVFSQDGAENSLSEHWTPEQELSLQKLVDIKDAIKNNADPIFHSDKNKQRLVKIQHLTDEAELLRKAKKLYHRTCIGLEQDAQFPRYTEYLTNLKKMHKKTTETPENQERFQRTTDSIQQFIHTLQEREQEAASKVLLARILKAEELVKTAIQSPPTTQREIDRKLKLLNEVHSTHLLPLQEQKLTPYQQTALERTLDKYTRALEQLTQQDEGE